MAVTHDLPLGQQGQPAGGSAGSLFIPMMAIMLLAYFMFMRPQQVRQRRYEQMIADLKENDQVVTTGGIHGVVTGIQREQQRVTLRVDDSTGAKIRVGLWAISHLVGEDDTDGAGAKGERGKKAETKQKSK